MNLPIMPHSPDLQTLADYLTGTFDNRSQAMDDPVLVCRASSLASGY
ncbi:MAG: hypothetical protein NT070_18300 [Cyanobacteria bacterium]|nr:hypothetical protein [Cyanobacteriota bacterium]